MHGYICTLTALVIGTHDLEIANCMGNIMSQLDYNWTQLEQ
jgi:hypothetical protein